jgi:NAD(P)-dependent dehydrogenase (short-subunit alcohol dehydrogenase family)
MKLDNCKTIIDKHLEHHGRLDILVNNASKQIMCEAIQDIDVSVIYTGYRPSSDSDLSSAMSRAPSSPTSSQ